ncbi:hypothetical protein [Glycomyces algeriensis]|uniref:Uncharacterized protein n=1 Tax=Glycomyces algeriensis TaxID=256037 RepID=A0A9W6LGM5_9ACTN|nr:hypothetical protein [Glycomyces algeriensis]MDA1366126.1 hypothetical protein [Glycomyces algeriensis]MDR7349106.1 hypothetical protein [Glycomyces algeriensis]GLI41806.1 hypothetical protein GALLR39Z86_16560 [Glycomyces algeriensis]
MVYDQNRPDEPQRPSGEERPARRRIGRSWGPPAEEAPEPAEEARQGLGQSPEQYRFDPDRGRRHRYSEDPTGQVPNVPVEIAETGPMVPATRRPSPGEQFEPIPPAPQHSQPPQNFQGEQQQSPFAPPGANHEHSAPPGANHELNAPPGMNQEYSAPPPGANQEYGAPPGVNQEYGPQSGGAQEYSAPGQNQEYSPPGQDHGAPQQHPGYSAPPMSGDYAAQQQHPNQGPPQPNQEFAPPGANQEYGANQEFPPPSANGSAPANQQEYGAVQDQNAQAQQFYSAPRQAMPSAPPANPQFGPPANQDFNAQHQHQQEYSGPQRQNQEFAAPPGMNQEYVPGANREYGATPSANGSAPAQEYSPQPATPQRPEAHETPQDQTAPPPLQPPGPQQHTGPIEVPHQAVPQTPSAPGPIPRPISNAEQQTEQFPIVQPQPPVTEVSPAAVPSPPVTEQAPLRSLPANRPPFAEPTPPATVEKDVNDPESARLVDAVRQVPGVRDAFHVTAPDGNSSLRLELEDGVDPDEVHAVVSAVVAEQRAVEPGPQTADEPEVHDQVESPSAEVEIAKVGPVELRRVEIESAGLEAEVSVTLALGDAESTGKVAVPPIDWHIQHAAAAATVEALRPRLGANDVRVEVEHASIVPTGPVKTAVVVILWLDGRSVRRLSGASVVTAERSRAVVSATLGALAGEVTH